MKPCVITTFLDAEKPQMIQPLKLLLAVLASTFVLSACTVQKEMDQKFGDQHFKTSIALIELHKIRFGEYPDFLSELKFAGEWDQIALTNVRYKKVTNGYELDVVNGWVGKPELNYPPEFWRNLGLVRSNMKP
jgi:hypothetical protein